MRRRPGSAADEPAPARTGPTPTGTTPGAGGRWLAAGALAVSVVAGAVATTTVVQAGHSGADAVWHDTSGGGTAGAEGGGAGALRP